MRALRKLLPDLDTLRSNRWLRWLGPALQHPRLWHFSRRGIALGMALGFFFGLLVPLAQMPLSAAAAVVLRANVPVAVASTLITNPLTFGPIYYAAWRLGSAVLGKPTPPPLPVDENGSLALPKLPPLSAANEDAPTGERWWQTATRWVLGVGKPLLLGLAIMATMVGLVTYFVVSLAWRLHVVWKRRRRRAR